MRLVEVERARVALVRYLLEAHEGLAFMYGDATEHIALLSPASQEAALERLIDDLCAEGLVRRKASDAPPEAPTR